MMNILRLAPALFAVFVACAEEPIDLHDTHEPGLRDTNPEDTNLEDTPPEDTSIQDTPPEETSVEETSLEDARTDTPDFVVDVSCAIAIITASPSETSVSPGTTVQLDGTQSHGDGTRIVQYLWDLDSPVESRAWFVPSSGSATPSLHLEVPGIYTVRLHVVDEHGTRSCVPATYTIAIAPPEGEFYAVLSWDTLDVAEEDGADLDLHLIHPYAKGGGRDLDGDGVGDGFCQIPFDAHWYNPRPNWGFLDPTIPDNPEITDSTRPNGVETATLPLLEDNTVYTLAIHAYKTDVNLVSQAKLQVFRSGILTFELSNIELISGDLWMALTFDKSSTELIRTCPDMQTRCASDTECGGERCGLRIHHGTRCHESD